MSTSPKNGADIDLRSLLKFQHKRVYAICRLFARNYKEHQRLFTDIIAAASQNIRTRKDAGDKEILVLRACFNMAALHSITLDMTPNPDRTIQFKSPDYQRSMTEFCDSIGETDDYEKFRLFLEFEKVPPAQMADITGLQPTNHHKPAKPASEVPKKHFIPYLKEKLVWS
jgi:hypothetical protein